MKEKYSISNTVLKAAAVIGVVGMFTTPVTATEPCGDFGECKAIIEINSTDGDVGFHFLMDGDDLIRPGFVTRTAARFSRIRLKVRSGSKSLPRPLPRAPSHYAGLIRKLMPKIWKTLLRWRIFLSGGQLERTALQAPVMVAKSPRARPN